MSRFIVKGLAGKKKLSGELAVKGAKNSVLKALAASLLFDDGCELEDVPLIDDVLKMSELLSDIGVIIKQNGEKSFFLKTPKNLKTDLCEGIAKSFRSSILLTGPLLAREGRVSFPHPGGCVIGKRPIDVFLEGFERMGAKINVDKNGYVIEAKKLSAIDNFFKVPSVTGTETLILTAVLIKGTTRLFNCACEPEIVSLVDFLNDAGADIRGGGTHTVVINGGKKLKRAVFKTPPDRIEAGSFAVIAALCGRNMKVTHCDPSKMRAIIHALQNAGVFVRAGQSWIQIDAPKKLKAVDIKTHEYPGFPTDLQSPFMVFLTQAQGKSLVFETVFEGRLNYVHDLVRMGADIVLCDPHRAIVSGPAGLRGREMESPDLRAGLAFLIAALTAEGNSIIHNINNIDRGYEKIEDRLNAVGADILREE